LGDEELADLIKKEVENNNNLLTSKRNIPQYITEKYTIGA